MIEIGCKDGETLLEACQKHHIFVDNVCGGTGICGKCKVRMLTNPVPVSEKERQFFSEEELEAGWRLSCLAKPHGICQIELPRDGFEELSVVTERVQTKKEQEKTLGSGVERTGVRKKQVLIIDIGTTTIAMQRLLCWQEQEMQWESKVLATYTAANRQRVYGVDVLSRIQFSNEGNGQLLKDAIMETLAKGMERLVGANCEGADSREDGSGNPVFIDHASFEDIYIAGNTTMIHLLLGYSCEQLGRAPFKPVKLEEIETRASDFFASYLKKSVLSQIEQAKVFIFPGISAFVGGDLVSGLYDTVFYKAPQVQLLVDLGTNGEMVVGNRMRLLATSTAAGPAFEGGGISCGCAGVKGAICGAKRLANGTWQFDTIGGKAPVGICGSGIVEIIYELLQAGLLDETGLLAEGNLERVELVEGQIFVTQQDVRQFQMAKAAIRAGVETLLRVYEIEAENLSRIYIAGGFGYFLNLDKATAIGLFPEDFQGKMLAVGNTCLGGLKAYATNPNSGILQNIRKYTGECSLAENAYFQEKYIQSMDFKCEKIESFQTSALGEG